MNGYLQPEWPAPPHIKAYTTLREGWGGRKLQQNPTDPSAESRRLQALLHLPEEPIWLTQTHSSIVIPAETANKEQIADASFTTALNRVCTVLTADCLPLLICNKAGTHIAAIHAGWRGLAGGIIENTLNALNQPSDDLLVWLGPAIGPSKFEVGEDVYSAFTNKHSESALAFIPHASGKWLANLYELAKIRLKFMGISKIYGGHFCTYSQEELFYSYRRDHGNTGRMASMIWIDQNLYTL